MLEELSKLEDQLRDLSHNQEALELIKDFANKLKKQDRQIIFSAEGSLIIKPIFHQDMLEKGLIDDNEDPFTLLSLFYQSWKTVTLFKRQIPFRVSIQVASN